MPKVISRDASDISRKLSGAYGQKQPVLRNGQALRHALAIIAIAIAIVGCALTGCNVFPSRTPTPLKALLLDHDALPPGWYVSQMTLPATGFFEGAVDSASVRFSSTLSKDMNIMHVIGRYKNRRQAERGYLFDVELWVFGEAGLLEPWAKPAALSYISPVAERFRLDCARTRTVEDGSRLCCIALGQYKEYVSILWVLTPQFSPDFMSMTDVEALLKEVDRRMVEVTGE